jgi:hypothetical protein
LGKKSRLWVKLKYVGGIFTITTAIEVKLTVRETRKSKNPMRILSHVSVDQKRESQSIIPQCPLPPVSQIPSR